MRLKTYYSGSVDEALTRASGELGPDAMLVYARDAAPDSRHPGLTEVVFAAPHPAVSTPGEKIRPDSDLAPVRAEIAGLVRMLSNSTQGSAQPADPATRARMIREIRTDATLRRGQGRASTVIFIGPPGCGKTISLVKLAARQITQRQPPPAIVAFDNRVGGGEPLRSYASALECAFEHAPMVEDVVAAGRAAGPGDLLLIDTPGLADGDETLAGALDELISRCRTADVQLALSAGMKAADLSAAVERFQRFRPTKLLFTRLDETGTYGPLWSEAVRWNIPVSFLTFGQQIPEDIEPATAVRLTDLALRPGSDWLRARRRKAMGASA